MRNSVRRTYTGKVVSDKMDKTITVLVTTYKTHPLYHKRINYLKKFKAHNPNNEAKIGDTVVIMETRPISATKKFCLVKVSKSSTGETK